MHWGRCARRRLEGERVKLAGKAVLYAQSELMLEGVQ